MRKLLLGLFLICRLVPAVTFTEDLQTKSLLYFVENANPKTGFVRVVAENRKPTPDSYTRSSIAATGFGMAIVANAAKRGIIHKDEAYEYIYKVLAHAAAIRTHHGWLPHYVDWLSLARVANTEFSTIDTALFLAGALYAAAIFPGTDLAKAAYALYDKVDFNDMRTDGGTFPNKMTLSMAYSPERNGYTKWQWSEYAEHMILLFLGLGSRTSPLPPAIWAAWERERKEFANGEALIGYNKPLFTHQYSHLFIDFRNFRDAHGNYFTNAQLATRYNKNACRKDKRYMTYKDGFWGLSAGDSPAGYRANHPGDYEGTACPACAVASCMFRRDVLDDAEAWRNGPYKMRLRGKYGVADGINVDKDWVGETVHGITVGPVYLAIANMKDETSVWVDFMRLPEIQRALSIAARMPPLEPAPAPGMPENAAVLHGAGTPVYGGASMPPAKPSDRAKPDAGANPGTILTHPGATPGNSGSTPAGPGTAPAPVNPGQTPAIPVGPGTPVPVPDENGGETIEPVPGSKPPLGSPGMPKIIRRTPIPGSGSRMIPPFSGPAYVPRGTTPVYRGGIGGFGPIGPGPIVSFPRPYPGPISGGPINPYLPVFQEDPLGGLIGPDQVIAYPPDFREKTMRRRAREMEREAREAARDAVRGAKKLERRGVPVYRSGNDLDFEPTPKN